MVTFFVILPRHKQALVYNNFEEHMLSTEFSLDQINEAADWLLEQTGSSLVLAFHGDMGAGKTTLIHALCARMGVKENVGSPTFSIINQYVAPQATGDKTIYHMDLYRLSGEEEAARAGVEDALYSGHFCLVEWPERAPGLFPDDTLHVFITLTEAGKRQLRIAGN